MPDSPRAEDDNDASMEELFGKSDDEEDNVAQDSNNNNNNDNKHSDDERKATEQELFGNSDDDDDNVEGKAAIRHSLEEDEEGEEEAPRRQQAIGPPLYLTCCNYPTASSDSQLVRVKLPNIVGIQSKPYDPETFVGDDEDEEDRKRKHTIPESVIRWRYAADGHGTKESNARIVKWSDGSMHLMLGGELLDVNLNHLDSEHLFLYCSQPNTAGAGGFLQSHGRLTHKMTIKPAGLQSKLHHKLSVSLAQKNQKVSKMKLVSTMVDPEVEKRDREKIEEDRIRSLNKIDAAQKNVAGSYNMDRRYLEGYDDDNDDYRNAPRRNRNDDYKADDFVVDDDEEEQYGGYSDEEQLEPRRRKNKNRRRSSGNDEEDAERLMNAKRDEDDTPARKRRRDDDDG
eukprot:TRINITY_DN1538_c0_g1_i3.p1 TRINITY_DN1538_c0_g1~~TRINITY_DN1538_c0_g1_i3.p1  ORF type:complete len:408 (-),score=131.73 TRINITY_DN1538_c0_g1_i3:156-1349(-)